uniref:Reelin domain-containing protein n=1 Tax=Anabas testudineus TaxID=64144 RepID=A0A3Q1HPN6_ANATE
LDKPRITSVSVRLRESVCYPNGQVEASCASMMPQHNLFLPSTSSPPYNVSASSDTYRPGQVITGRCAFT